MIFLFRFIFLSRCFLLYTSYVLGVAYAYNDILITSKKEKKKRLGLLFWALDLETSLIGYVKKDCLLVHVSKGKERDC
jgi:hypothetical protein